MMIVAAESMDDCGETNSFFPFSIIELTIFVDIVTLLNYTHNMPVTKTAKRALRSSKKKESVNNKTLADLEIAIRQAKKKKSAKAVNNAISMIDRAAKKNLLHKNKASRMKSQMAKLAPKKASPISKKKTNKK